jgi:hypothetical protein
MLHATSVSQSSPMVAAPGRAGFVSDSQRPLYRTDLTKYLTKLRGYIFSDLRGGHFRRLVFAAKSGLAPDLPAGGGFRKTR